MHAYMHVHRPVLGAGRPTGRAGVVHSSEGKIMIYLEHPITVRRYDSTHNNHTSPKSPYSSPGGPATALQQRARPYQRDG
jgi:hypothetical protein